MTALPEGPLVAWYGDDFTGAAATMEVLSFAGLPSVLFLDVPTAAQEARFAGMRGIGIAGTARSQDPDWMDRNLPRFFAYLSRCNAPINHYKTCSTFDSAPHVGSIGRAAEIGLDTFASDWVPMVVAAPPLGRWQAFGNLFAAAPDGVHRLDRHPVMTHHPVTPMNEADLCRHIGRQTDLRTALIDFVTLGGDPAKASGASEAAAVALAALRTETDPFIVSLDVLDAATLTGAGQLIWEQRQKGQFVLGSQGIEYALIAYWQASGALPPAKPPSGAGPVEDIVAVSGSVSPVTADQISWAAANGFETIRLDAASVADDCAMQAAEDAAVRAALDVAKTGAAPLILTATGPDDPAIPRFLSALSGTSLSKEAARERMGAALGRILQRVLETTGTRRAIISGGDTSGHATHQLGIYALTALAPTIPGAALLKAHADDARFDGLELALKGGQMGAPDYFGAIRAGGGARAAMK